MSVRSTSRLRRRRRFLCAFRCHRRSLLRFLLRRRLQSCSALLHGVDARLATRAQLRKLFELLLELRDRLGLLLKFALLLRNQRVFRGQLLLQLRGERTLLLERLGELLELGGGFLELRVGRFVGIGNELQRDGVVVRDAAVRNDARRVNNVSSNMNFKARIINLFERLTTNLPVMSNNICNTSLYLRIISSASLR